MKIASYRRRCQEVRLNDVRHGLVGFTTREVMRRQSNDRLPQIKHERRKNPAVNCCELDGAIVVDRLVELRPRGEFNQIVAAKQTGSGDEPKKRQVASSWAADCVPHAYCIGCSRPQRYPRQG
jgi:hypothetical protein